MMRRIVARVLGWLDRQGGMLIAPRQTVAALGPDEGARDGTWAVLVYMLAMHVADVIAAIAKLVALRDIGVVADVAMGLVVPFMTTFAVELALGKARAHRAGVCLAPMLLVAASLHLLDVGGVIGWPMRWLPGVIAGLCAVAFAVWLRPSITPRKEATI
ncbi:MAG: hypothetical protein IAG13_36480 [Deltaproteobacteria bacterium]|nr:hypothetical protein [Nannocystaceae bacterium]